VKYLRVVDGLAGEEYEYPLERDVVTVGSQPDNSIVLDEIEPFHFEIQRLGKGFKALDRHTDMGTRVNGEWMIQKVLGHGDEIVLGPHRLVFCDPDTTQKPSPVREKPTRREIPSRPPAQAAGVAPSLRRKNKGPSVSTLFAFLLVAAAVVVCWMLISGVDDGMPQQQAADRRPDPRFDKVEDLKGKGLFEPARTMLDVIASSAAPSKEMLDRVQKEIGELDRLEKLETIARADLAALADELDNMDPAEAEAAVKRFREDFGELAYLFGDLEEIARSSSGRAAAGKQKPGSMTAEEARARARALLAEKDYSTALAVWKRFDPQTSIDLDLKKTETALIETKAKAEAKIVVSKVIAMAGEGKYKNAMNLLTPAKLARFRGTPLYENLVARALEVEKEAGIAPHPLRPVDLSRSDDEAVAKGKGARPSSSGKGVSPNDPRPAIPDDDFVDLDAVIQTRNYERAISVLQRLVNEARTPEEKKRIAVRAEYVYRQTWFFENLEACLDGDPDRAERVFVKTAAGDKKGKFHSIVNSVVNLAWDDDINQVLLEEIEPRSLYRLARVYALSIEDKLNMACFCLNAELRAEFDGLAAEIREEGTFQRSLDAILAMDAGGKVDVAALFSPHLLDGRYVSHEKWREAVLEREIENFKKMITSKKAEVRNEGYRGFLDLGPVSFDVLEETLRKRRADLVRELSACPEIEKIDKLAEAKRELNRRREHALELIFDRERYFYPYKHRQGDYWKVQQEVDLRVEGVREIWGDEFDDDIPGAKVKLSSGFCELRDDLNQVGIILDDISDGVINSPGAEAAGHAAEIAGLLPPGGRTIHIRNIALDNDEREMIDTSAYVMDYNETTETSADKNENKQIWITNRYRMMLGRYALAVNELLLQSARSHSDWMSRTGKFGHFEDTDDRRTPMDRMRQAGYDKGGGENCYMGSGSPMAAHSGWIRSSGHHRNLLAPSHTEMGSGACGGYWTQNFGGGGEFDENLIEE